MDFKLLAVHQEYHSYNILLVRAGTNLGNVGKENERNDGIKSKVVLQVKSNFGS